MIQIPDGVGVDVSGSVVTVSGPKGSVSKKFSARVVIEKSGSNALEVKGAEKEKALVNTTEALIRNMIKGVTEGYSKRLKILYAHFPATMEVKGNLILIKNFLGEKNPRKAKIMGGSTKVEVKGQQLTVTGVDKEAVGQTVANLKAVLKIKDKDPRVFQDSVYEIIEG
ncbi:MAG: 50S ribosomal protein L6 [Candidatus Bilamarchaeaceae archaeon]